MSCVLDRIRGGAKRDGNVKRNERIRKDMVAVGECKQVDRLVDSGGGGLGVTCAPLSLRIDTYYKKAKQWNLFHWGKKNCIRQINWDTMCPIEMYSFSPSIQFTNGQCVSINKRLQILTIKESFCSILPSVHFSLSLSFPHFIPI